MTGHDRHGEALGCTMSPSLVPLEGFVRGLGSPGPTAAMVGCHPSLAIPWRRGLDQWRWIQWINGSMGTSNFEAVEHVSWEGTFALTSSVSMPALVLRCGDLPGDGRWKCFSEGSRR